MLNNPNAKAIKYLDDELRELASFPEIKNKYAVRLVEAKYAASNQNLSRAIELPDGSAVVKHWSTSFDMLHWCDTDAELIRRAIGFSSSDFKPPYKLAIIDLEAYKKATNGSAFVPTFENMRNFAQSLKSWSSADLDIIITKEFNDNSSFGVHFTLWTPSPT